MPRSENASRTGATTSFSCATPTAAKTGVVSVELGAGLAVCATTQIVQDAFSVWPGWMWIDSAAAVQSIKDRHNHAEHRTHDLMNIPSSRLDCV